MLRLPVSGYLVKVFIYRYTGEDTKSFTNGKRYVGRISKAGNHMARDNRGVWVDIFNKNRTVNRLQKYMEVEETVLVNAKTVTLETEIEDIENRLYER